VSSPAADPTIRRQVVAAARIVLASDARAPVARIARAAGVSRATVYRHFGSRRALLGVVDRDPLPDSRTRILDAAQEMLLTRSLSELSMDELASAAGVSRGTLYRLYPGKSALLRAMMQRYSPFGPMQAVLAEHRDEAPHVVLPLLARAVVGAAGGRLGLMRAIIHEATSGSPASLAAVRPVLGPALGGLADYLARQMSAGRLRPMDPFLALQAFLGPIYFHLTTRQTLAEIVEFDIGVDDAVDELARASLEGLAS
jgi:AcrR family transcriptional regulator